MGEQGAKNIWIQRDSLALKLGISVSTVGRAIKDLVGKELLLPQEDRHENRYKTYERKAEASQVCGHPGTCSRDPSYDDAGGLDSGNKSRNDHSNDHNMGVMVPKELFQEIEAVKLRVVGPLERAKAMAHVIMQFIPATVSEDGVPLSFIVPSVIVPLHTFTPLSDNIDDLRYQFQKVMAEGKPGSWSEGLMLSQRISGLERQQQAKAK